MDLSVLGWILTMADLHAIGGPKFQVKDLSVEVDNVSTLKETILKYPGFSIENFRQTGFYRSGDIAMFASSPLRNYLFGDSKNPEEQALLIILSFEPRKDSIDDTKNSGKEPLHFILPNKNLNPVVTNTLLKYADDSFKKSHLGQH